MAQVVCNFCGLKVKTQGLLRHINSNATCQEAQRQHKEEEESDLDRKRKARGKVTKVEGTTRGRNDQDTLEGHPPSKKQKLMAEILQWWKVDLRCSP